jgi:hypothetical protein
MLIKHAARLTNRAVGADHSGGVARFAGHAAFSLMAASIPFLSLMCSRRIIRSWRSATIACSRRHTSPV